MSEHVEAKDIREVEDLVRSVFGIGDGHDVILFQAEAIALLEAAAKALARPGDKASVILTSIYGEDFAQWFEDGGGDVRRLDLTSPLRPATERDALDVLATHPDLLAVVQGEALTGLVNPIDEIAGHASEQGTVLLIDSVSSIGSEPFTPTAWGPAISIAGFQKAAAGPAGVSVAVIERSLWERIEANPRAPRHSFVSLLDIKSGWLDAGRVDFGAAPNSEEVRELRRALQRMEAVGAASIEADHRLAAALARGLVDEMEGLERLIPGERSSGISTLVRLTGSPVDRGAVLGRLQSEGITSIKTAPGDTSLRWMHYGADAELERVADTGRALARALISVELG